MAKNKSIKNRLVKNFMLVIVITVFILQVALTKGIKEYYYKNVEDILVSQIQSSTDFYSRYYLSYDLEDIILDDMDSFWRDRNSQVQILTVDGELLMDSIGVTYDQPILTADVEDAKNLKTGVWTGSVYYSREPVMAVSVPLMNKGEATGIIRFISSLEETNKSIARINIFLGIMGLVVIGVSGLVSLFLANSIVKPLVEVTEAAEKLADGQYKVRSNVDLDDEIGRLSNTLNHMAE